MNNIRRKTLRVSVQSVALIAVIALAFYLARLAQGNGAVQEIVAAYGYAGIFVVSVVSGFNLVVPVPAIAFLPLFLTSGLSFLPTILVIAAGVSLADSVAYFAGRIGRHVLAYAFEERLILRLERVRERYHWAPLTAFFLFAAFVPLPNEILVVPLGLLGYRFLQILPVAFAGNLAFNSLYATGTIGLFNLF